MGHSETVAKFSEKNNLNYSSFIICLFVFSNSLPSSWICAVLVAKWSEHVIYSAETTLRTVCLRTCIYSQITPLGLALYSWQSEASKWSTYSAESTSGTICVHVFTVKLLLLDLRCTHGKVKRASDLLTRQKVHQVLFAYMYLQSNYLNLEQRR